MRINGELLLVVNQSKKDKDKTYVALCVNLGYSLKFLTFDSYLISELLNITIQELRSLEVGEYEVEI